MTDKYRALLTEWCDALVRAQITDEREEDFGGFRCESCSFTHGRADNAIYPFLSAYSFTKDERYLAAVERLLAFRRRVSEPSGAVVNDFTSPWEGITAFSAIGLMKSLLYYGEILPDSLKGEIERAAIRSARWVNEKMTLDFPAYINYYCAASLANALYDALYSDEAYRARAKELLDYCLTLFTENGLLAGEGKPHDARSPKGCLPIDIGYIVEESLPCLLHAAALLGEKEAFATLKGHAAKLLDFLLPDGGWDNSFGVRNNKWTYYGSRTSDGCIGAFALLAKEDDRFASAAERTYAILRACTHGGLLYGGAQQFENGQKPCVHHTFCHASALADAIREGIGERGLPPLPKEAACLSVRYYPELDTYLIRTGAYRATITAYDFATQHFTNGAAHAGGGTLSLLYKEGKGALIAGSVYEYRRTEPNNMQSPAGERAHATLLPRAEYEKNGVKYATVLDPAPEIKVWREGETILATVKAKCCDIENRRAEEGVPAVEFLYRFAADGVTIQVGKAGKDVRFVLPLIEGRSEIESTTERVNRPIFFLTGGFAAEEHTFSLEESVTITIR